MTQPEPQKVQKPKPGHNAQSNPEFQDSPSSLDLQNSQMGRRNFLGIGTGAIASLAFLPQKRSLLSRIKAKGGSVAVPLDPTFTPFLEQPPTGSLGTATAPVDLAI
jgi:hypothetical protein